MKITQLACFLLFLGYFVSAYCPPYFAEISSTENVPACLQIGATSGCGGEVSFQNNCDYLFSYAVGKNASIVDEIKPGDTYYATYPSDNRGPSFDVDALCWKCPEDYCAQMEAETPGAECRCSGYAYSERTYTGYTVDGVDVCDVNSLKNGMAVKYWTIELKSSKDGPPVKVSGRTAYQHTSIQEFFAWLIAGYVVFSALAWFVVRKVLRKEFFNWILLLLTVVFVLIAYAALSSFLLG